MRIIHWLFIGIRILILCGALFLAGLLLWPGKFQTILGSDEMGSVTTMEYEFDEYEQQLFALDNNLPHHIYKRLEDSIKNLQSLQKISNQLSLEGWGFGEYGFYKTNHRKIVVYDSSIMHYNTQLVPDSGYFIGLDNYYLKEDHSTFRKQDTTFLKYPVITKRDSVNKRITGHYKTKPLLVEVEDLPEKITTTDNQKRILLIPVTKAKYAWYVIFITLFELLYLLFVIWGIILQPLRVLEDIANQEVFEKKTYQKLYITCYCLWGSLVFDFLMRHLMHWHFSSYIDPAFYIRLSDSITGSFNIIITGIITMAIAYAFKKGYQLQEDQNLTI